MHKNFSWTALDQMMTVYLSGTDKQHYAFVHFILLYLEFTHTRKSNMFWPKRTCIIGSNNKSFGNHKIPNVYIIYYMEIISRVTLYTAGHLHTAVPHCSHSRAPIVHTAVPRENNEHGCVYLRCRAVCKLPGCVEGHPWICNPILTLEVLQDNHQISLAILNHAIQSTKVIQNHGNPQRLMIEYLSHCHHHCDCRWHSTVRC